MAVTVKHVNDDASFLLSFEPLLSDFANKTAAEPFRILLDPWLTGASTVVHPKLSITTHKAPPCVSSLGQLPAPDVVIISQSKTDHCHEATLRQLPAFSAKTAILAEPTSAKLIRGWKYFDPQMVRTIPKWEGSEFAGRETVIKVPVPALTEDGEPGEVTVAFIPQKRDISSLHGAIGITYHPPSAPATLSPSPRSSDRLWNATQAPWSPPPMPKSHKSFGNLRTRVRSPRSPQQPPSPPSRHAAATVEQPTATTTTHTLSRKALRTVRSLASLASPKSPQSPRVDTREILAPSKPGTRQPPLATNRRPVSLIFAPHGIAYPSLHAYAVSHLAPMGALPLTALLHCFDAIDNPWWLGGNVLLGAPAGVQIAHSLGARVWISAHDGNKDVRGIATGKLRTRKWSKDEVEEVVSPRSLHGLGGLPSPAAGESDDGTDAVTTSRKIEVLALSSGEEVALTEEGIWNAVMVAQ